MVSCMRLSTKMILLFSIVMAAATAVFSSYAVQSSLEGATMFTSARFTNMSASISLDIEQNVEMMRLTLNTLKENASFMSALNQFIRDDSEDQKLGVAARTAALQQLHQSPLVDQYYCVAFFNQNGQSFSSSMEKDGSSINIQEILNLLGDTPQEYLLSPSSDVLSLRQGVQVYGLVQPVQYHGNLLGYLAILNEYSSLDHIMTFVDNNDEVMVQSFFDDGSLFYSSKNTSVHFPLDIPMDEMVCWTDPETQTIYDVRHSHIDSLGLHLFLAQDGMLAVMGNMGIRTSVIQRALLIMLPAFALITLLSLSLTKSIRRLTKKVQRTPSGSILLNDSTALQTLNQTVTSSTDKEIHALELAYNHMMLRLRENAVNELTLREGTLQAQLSALQTQINPHFIYNTLNIISAKSMESGNLEIIEICDQFASMLRYSTDTRSRTATIQEEIENVRNYLLLAKARYEENLEFIIDVPDGLNDINVPKLTLQPLVENALTHGFDGKNILRRLSIIGTLTDKALTLTIRDNGTGFSDEMLENLRQRIQEIDAGMVSIEKSGGHIGLINTCLRLHYYSKGRMHVTIHNDHGAVITLTMPVS